MARAYAPSSAASDPKNQGRGTEVAAVLYTLLESAKLAGVEPRAYVRAAAEAALTGGPPLLPHLYREQLRAERAAMRSALVSPPGPFS